MYEFVGLCIGRNTGSGAGTDARHSSYAGIITVATQRPKSEIADANLEVYIITLEQ